jgi:hypothetical protein
VRCQALREASSTDAPRITLHDLPLAKKSSAVTVLENIDRRVPITLWHLSNVALGKRFPNQIGLITNGCGSHDSICHIILGSRYADRGVA